jgi:hypothetical protein
MDQNPKKGRLANGVVKLASPVGHFDTACASREEAMAMVAERIYGRWGYRIFDAEESLTPSDIWVRRACVLYLTTIYSVIDPSWNDF